MRALPVGFAVVVSALGAIASAQDSRVHAPMASPQAVPAGSPSVKALIRGVNDEAHTTDLFIRQLDVQVAVRGAIAETVMDMELLAPPNTGPVEGRVHIDLPAGSVVTGYALDANGGLVDGSLIDQSTARTAFNRQVRGQVDPGLAEIDQTGGFNTRVFPIDGQKGRKLRLRFVTPVGTGYRLPLKLPATAGNWSVITSRVDSGGASVARSSGKGMLDTVVQIRAGGGDESIASRHSTGETYLQLAGKLPARQADQGGTLRIYWDKSRSRRDHDHQAEYRRVREAIAALKPDRIEWVAFSSGEPERALVKDADEAVRRASALRYGGATSFGKIAGDAPARNCLLVSDGRPTIDGTPAAALPCRLFAIATQGSDLARLGAMAQASGGQLVTAEQKAVDWLSPAVTAVLGPDGRRLKFTSLPAAPGEWRVAAKAPATTGPVRVMVGDVTIGRNVDPNPANFDGEGSLMAAASLAALDSATDRPRFIALSRRYSVASPTMSFVVLEQPEDYVINKIAPPANYTRRREWEELAAEAEEDLADAKAGRLAAVRKEWAEQVAWWERKFDLTARPVARGNKARLQDAIIGSSVRNEPPPGSAPPPPPPPPPASEPERDGDFSDESTAELVVTGTRIPSSNLESASPVTTVGNNALNQSPSSRPDVRIAVSAWRPDRDYLNAFDADPAAFDRAFSEWDQKAGGVPAFYLDTADWLDRRGKRAEALETLMSALDLPTANEITVGMVAGRLERWGLIDEAIALRERQAALDPEHPQPKRLLALALAKRGTKADLDRAIRLLTDIALNPVDGNWEGIDMIALVEANALIPRYRAMGGKVDLDPALIRNLDSDVRIVIDWTSDAVDIDLWVDEPNGERAIFNHNRTSIGGHLSNDMTQGYGPEEYFIRRGAIGRYSVIADVYASDRIDPNGVSRITAHLFRDWGRPNQRVESIDLDLQSGKADKVKIGTLRVGGAAAGSQ